MTEPVIQPEPIPEDFYMFDITVVYIDLSISSMSLLLIIISTFEFE